MVFTDRSDKNSENASVVSRKKPYSDLDLKLKRHPLKGDIIPLKDIEAIKQSVKNLILTSKKERLFQPWLGSGVSDLLFEPADKVTISAIKQEIYRVIDKYEPRVIIDSLDIIDNADLNSYKISITFEIINLVENVEIEFYLERVR